VPILSITPIMGQKPDAAIGPDGGRNSALGHAVMHSDWRELKSLFKEHPNVKLALSGHLHLVDEVKYGGVSYMCNGAVSGGWWKGAHLGEGDAGYALLDLYDDGRFNREYVPYGWTYRDADKPAAKPVG
jgi:predicted phosphodiesterase